MQRSLRCSHIRILFILKVKKQQQTDIFEFVIYVVWRKYRSWKTFSSGSYFCRINICLFILDNTDLFLVCISTITVNSVKCACIKIDIHLWRTIIYRSVNCQAILSIIKVSILVVLYMYIIDLSWNLSCYVQSSKLFINVKLYICCSFHNRDIEHPQCNEYFNRKPRYVLGTFFFTGI